jgi:hypothetical protein
MERKMCSYLEWQLNIDLSTLHDFESCVHHNFVGPGPSPLSCCNKLHLHIVQTSVQACLLSQLVSLFQRTPIIPGP